MDGIQIQDTAETPNYLLDLLRTALTAQRIKLHPSLKVLREQLATVRGLSPTDIQKQLPEFYAVRALMYILAAIDQDPVSRKDYSGDLINTTFKRATAYAGYSWSGEKKESKNYGY